MGARIQAKWNPTQYQYPAAALTMFALPNPSAGIEAYQESLIERKYCFRQSEIPARAEFLLGCAESGLVSDATLERLADNQSLVMMERAINEAIVHFGPSFKIGRKPFTKSAKRMLRRIGERTFKEISPEHVALVVEEALEADLLEPNNAVRLVQHGTSGVKLLLLDAIRALDGPLPPNVTASISNEGLHIYCNNVQGICMYLPTDDDEASHALRIAVMNALSAISTGIATFFDPQEMLGIEGYFTSRHAEMWDYFKSQVAGKSIQEIEAIIAASDPDKWPFETYFLGADDPSELQPGSEEFERMVAILHEISVFQRLFSINASDYHRDFQAACNAQIDIVRSLTVAYPQHAPVYTALIEVFTRALHFQSSGLGLNDLAKLVAHDDDADCYDGCMGEHGAVLQGLFVRPSDDFPNLGDAVDEDINSMYGNYGLPSLTIPLEPGVVARLAAPMIEAISEVFRLIEMMVSALEEVGYVGDKH